MADWRKVDRITEEHIGWKTRSGSIVLAIHGNVVWLKCSDETYSTNTVFQWELLPPAPKPKKPSERIEEMIGKTHDDVEWNMRAVEKIIEFLDEQHEREENK